MSTMDEARAEVNSPTPKRPKPKLREVPAYTPFPIEYLPPVVSEFVGEAAGSLGVDPGMIAPHALATVAGMIGCTRALRIKSDWREYPIVWAVTVSSSGTLKTPCQKIVLRPVYAIVRELRVEHKRLVAKYKEAKRNKEEPEPPPPCKRHLISDVTIERIGSLLDSNPRGLFLARDELSGWFRSFSKYSSNKETDTSNWLQLHSAGELTIDRQNKDLPEISVPSACLSVCGSIQPGIFEKCLSPEHRESGLAARLLVVQPPERPKEWTELEVDPQTHQRYESLIRCLSSLAFADKEDNPVIVRFTADAKKKWVQWFKKWAVRQFDAQGDYKSFLAKLEAYCARFALIDHIVESCLSPNGRFEGVNASSVEKAIKLTEWFDRERVRIEAMMGETAAEADFRCLYEWARGRYERQGPLAVRDLQKSHYRKYPTKDEAKAALDSLVEADLGYWRQEALHIKQTSRRRGHQRARQRGRRFGRRGRHRGENTTISTGKCCSCLLVCLSARMGEP